MKKLVIGMIAHVDAGKTTLSEALLYHAGNIRSMGKVDNGDTFFDTRTYERERGITIFSKQAVLSLPGCMLTLLDTPGHVDFSAETERAIAALDYAVLVISGTDGVQDHTETLWSLLAHYGIPTVLFVNKMDRPGTDEQVLLKELKKRLSDNIVNLSHKDPEDLSLLSEEILAGYLSDGSIDESRFPDLIKKRHMFPCFFGSALRDRGVTEFLNALPALLQAPAYKPDFGARVYKITYDSDRTRLTHMKITGGTLRAKMPVGPSGKCDQIRIYSGEKYETVPEADAGTVCAVTGLSESRAGDVYGSEAEGSLPVLEPVLSYRLIPINSDAVQLLPKLRLLEEEDPTLRVIYEETMRELHLQVMGPIRLEILKRELLSRFGADVTFDAGSIVYKETIAGPAEGVGHFEPLRHYAEVHLLVRPLPRGSGLVFDSELSEDLLSKNWQRLILTHLNERNHRGILTGSVLTDVHITLVAGKAHPKHTEGGDFRQATYRAVRNALMQAGCVLLEPEYAFRLTTPEESLGRVMHALNLRKASFDRESDTADGNAVLTGVAPVSLLSSLPEELPALTKGRGHITCRVNGYRECHNPEEVIAARGYDPEADLRNPSGSVFCTHGSGFTVPWQEVPNYMHLPFVCSAPKEEKPDEVRIPPSNLIEQLDIALGTEEIDEILHRSTHANVNAKKKAPERKPEPKPYRGTETKHLSGPAYLLVDGYNIIHAWPELSSLSETNLDAARSKLLDTLCNFRGYGNEEIIVVFDAYLVKGHGEEYFDYHNIHVVFTKEAETADRYIERFTHEHAQNRRIRVATSDGLEQIIIRGEGSYVLSARELQEEVLKTEQTIREILRNN